MEFVNSKGVKYYLHYRNVIFGRGKRVQRNYFFSKFPNHVMSENSDLPIGFKVSETPKGMPVLKKL